MESVPKRNKTRTLTHTPALSETENLSHFLPCAHTERHSPDARREGFSPQTNQQFSRRQRLNSLLTLSAGDSIISHLLRTQSHKNAAMSDSSGKSQALPLFG